MNSDDQLFSSPKKMTRNSKYSSVFKNSDRTFSKVEKILKGSLDSILSPSRNCEHLNFFVFIFFAKHCWVLSTNFVEQKVC
jgi:hypothetical protein